MPVQVELADPAITVHGWTKAMDKIGEYTLKLRKTPEEIKAERETLRARFGGTPKVNPMKYEKGTVIEHDADDPETVYFLPGLWPRVKDWMEKNNVEYEITADNRNPDIRPPIDFEAIKDVQFRENQDLALALIATADCGIIETSVGWGKSFIISVLCRAFPKLNILITTGSTQVVNTLYEYLCKQVPGQVGILMGGKNTTNGKRIVVSTLRSLCKIPVDNVHLLCCDEAHEVADNQAGRDIMRFVFARKFGFTASPIRNSGDGLVLESIFGPTILKMTYEQAAESGIVVPMRYTMIPCNWGPSICHKEGISDVLLKRYAYWRNDVRNKAIANYVHQIHKADPNGQILVMVQTLEAAIALHMVLPWFKVAYYGASEFSDMEKKFPKEKYPNLDLKSYKMTQKQLDIMRAAFAKGTLRFIISTTVFRQGVNFSHLKYLVRADGATSKIMGIQIPGRLSRLDEGKDCAYLIDIDDTFCPWSARRSDCRDKQYQEQGWTKMQPGDMINDIIGKVTIPAETTAGQCGTEES